MGGSETKAKMDRINAWLGGIKIPDVPSYEYHLSRTKTANPLHEYKPTTMKAFNPPATTKVPNIFYYYPKNTKITKQQSHLYHPKVTKSTSITTKKVKYHHHSTTPTTKRKNKYYPRKIKILKTTTTTTIKIPLYYYYTTQEPVTTTKKAHNYSSPTPKPTRIRKSYYHFGRILETSIGMIGNFVPAHYLENILDSIKIF